MRASCLYLTPASTLCFSSEIEEKESAELNHNILLIVVPSMQRAADQKILLIGKIGERYAILNRQLQENLQREKAQEKQIILEAVVWLKLGIMGALCCFDRWRVALINVALLITLMAILRMWQLTNMTYLERARYRGEAYAQVRDCLLASEVTTGHVIAAHSPQRLGIERIWFQRFKDPQFCEVVYNEYAQRIHAYLKAKAIKKTHRIRICDLINGRDDKRANGFAMRAACERLYREQVGLI